MEDGGGAGEGGIGGGDKEMGKLASNPGERAGRKVCGWEVLREGKRRYQAGGKRRCAVSSDWLKVKMRRPGRR